MLLVERESRAVLRTELGPAPGLEIQVDARNVYIMSSSLSCASESTGMCCEGYTGRVMVARLNWCWRSGEDCDLKGTVGERCTSAGVKRKLLETQDELARERPLRGERDFPVIAEYEGGGAVDERTWLDIVESKHGMAR